VSHALELNPEVLFQDYWNLPIEKTPGYHLMDEAERDQHRQTVFALIVADFRMGGYMHIRRSQYQPSLYHLVTWYWVYLIQ